MNKIAAAFKAAFPLTVPVMLGYLFLGIAFGVMLSQSGYPPVWALGMSCFIFAGSMQFVCVDLLLSPFSLAGTALMTLMVNARHSFYAISMLDRYKGKPARPYLIFGLTDETYSILCSAKTPEGVDENLFYFFVTALDQLYWITGSVVGAVVGGLLPFNTDGIDFVMTALFTVIFVEQWEDGGGRVPAAVGVGLTLLCLLIFGRDGFLIPAMALILIVLAVLKRPLEARERGQAA